MTHESLAMEVIPFALVVVPSMATVGVGLLAARGGQWRAVAVGSAFLATLTLFEIAMVEPDPRVEGPFGQLVSRLGNWLDVGGPWPLGLWLVLGIVAVAFGRMLQRPKRA